MTNMYLNFSVKTPSRFISLQDSYHCSWERPVRARPFDIRGDFIEEKKLSPKILPQNNYASLDCCKACFRKIKLAHKCNYKNIWICICSWNKYPLPRPTFLPPPEYQMVGPSWFMCQKVFLYITVYNKCGQWLSFKIIFLPLFAIRMISVYYYYYYY